MVPVTELGLDHETLVPDGAGVRQHPNVVCRSLPPGSNAASAR